ncbi:MAG: DEAD/DEAH box helicase [Rubripirellula sp.]
MSDFASNDFPEIRFQGKLRPSQTDVVAIAREQLAAGQRRLHVVAPPGSGKTVLGLYLWAELVQKPALVLSPNSAIQGQWAARTSLFARADSRALSASVSMETDLPGLLTSLTYQSITMPARATEHLDRRAQDLWVQTLLEEAQAESSTEAEVWIGDLERHNPDHFNDRLAHYRKRIREDDALGGRAMGLLHESCLDTLVRLRESGVGLLILDECHHLLGHWGRVLSEVGEYFGDPVIVGLTATPPDRGGRKPQDLERYDKFFGEIDFEVPVPAVVKDGFLAPFQDLAFFVRPTTEELAFIAKVDEQFEDLMKELCQPRKADVKASADPEKRQRESLLQWLQRVLRDKQLPASRAANWTRFHARDPEFAESAVWFLKTRGIDLPADIPLVPNAIGVEDQHLVTLIDRYTRHCLRRSAHAEDHQLAERAVERLRMLGIQITDAGARPCASPVSRVIAYTRNKTQAIVPILCREMGVLGPSIRAVVIADYEKTSAISAEVAHLLDEEAGGAVAAFRALLADAKTNGLDPVLLTGSTVLVDADLVDRLLSEARQWLSDRSKTVELSQSNEGSFSIVTGRGGDWCPRVYVEMITDLFQRGVTRCLVGTRGLLGEGWDANTINVLIDLSTVTTSMTVNQLKGRSIRLDPNDPDKLANNWDVVCIAPEFAKGLDDYGRFIRKHKTLFGICDDGAIEKGVGHVHAAFTELKPELLEGSVSALNADMLARASRRAEVYKQWRIGQPYSPDPIRAIEVGGRAASARSGFPPFKGAKNPWSENSLARAVGEVILAALQETGQLKRRAPLKVLDREGGYIRVFLENADEEDANRFATALREALGRLESPRYVIPRFVDVPKDSFINRLLPGVLRRFFERRGRQMVMLHAVPSDLASKRDIVDVYQKHWNALVSPGDAVFAKNEKGQQVISEAVKARQLPEVFVHDKEVFL